MYKTATGTVGNDRTVPRDDPLEIAKARAPFDFHEFAPFLVELFFIPGQTLGSTAADPRATA